MSIILRDGTISTQVATVDSNGNLHVSLSGTGGIANPLPTTDAADGTTGATAPTKAIEVGGIAATANPTAVTNGQLVGAMADKVGKLVIVTAAPRQLVAPQVTTITNSTSETTIVTAGASGVFNDITGFQITNATGTAVSVTIKDATSGTTRKIFDLAASGGIVVHFNPPLPQSSAAANWTATLSVTGVTVDINVDYVKNI